MSFVRCAVRVMCTSKVPMSISRPLAIASMARSRRSMARDEQQAVGIVEMGQEVRSGDLRVDVGVERRDAPGAGDPLPHRDQPSEQVAFGAQRLLVEALDRALELLGDLEEAIQVPVEDGDDELDRPQRPDLALVGDLLPLPIEALEWLARGG